MKKILFLVLVLLAGFGIYRSGALASLLAMIDRTPPRLEVTQDLAGLGFDARPLGLTLSDEGAGVASVRVTAEQNGSVIELLSQSFETPHHRTEIVVPISGREKGLVEGRVTIAAQIVDASLFKNGASISRELVIDLAKPRIELLTQQFRAREAGAEFVMFRAKDANLVSTGVRVGEVSFPALKAGEIDPALSGQADLYGALFAIPFESISAGKRAVIYATDSAKNETVVALNFALDQFKQAEVSPKINANFVNEKIDDLIPGYERRSGKRVQLDRSSDEGLANAFKVINEEYRAVLEGILQEVMTAGAPSPVKWKGIFMKPMPSATSSTLGEKRHYFLNTVDAGRSLHNGLDLASVSNDAVKAANDGVVVLAEEFGIYGNAIVIDHGLGVFSLYGHLASVERNPGDAVVKGDVIGRSGKTGLAGGDHLHFEIRVRGVPVTPIEWWDPKWMQDDFWGKIEGVKTMLAPQPSPTPGSSASERSSAG